MGESPLTRPARLAEKLTHIRNALGLSRDEMLSRLGLSNTEGMFRNSISSYGMWTREPPLPVLLEYSRRRTFILMRPLTTVLVYRKT